LLVGQVSLSEKNNEKPDEAEKLNNYFPRKAHTWRSGCALGIQSEVANRFFLQRDTVLGGRWLLGAGTHPFTSHQQLSSVSKCTKSTSCDPAPVSTQFTLVGT
jgi:hypothetical protein